MKKLLLIITFATLIISCSDPNRPFKKVHILLQDKSNKKIIDTVLSGEFLLYKSYGRYEVTDRELGRLAVSTYAAVPGSLDWIDITFYGKHTRWGTGENKDISIQQSNAKDTLTVHFLDLNSTNAEGKIIFSN